MTRPLEKKQYFSAPVFFLCLLILISALSLTVFTNHWVYYQYKDKLPAEISGKLLFTLPGEMKIDQAVLRKGEAFTAKMPRLLIKYRAADLLFKRTFQARIFSENAELRFQDFTKINQSTALLIQRAEIALRVSGREDVEIESLFLESDEITLSGKGAAGENHLDLRITCTLKPVITSRIPDFIMQNIFTGGKGNSQEVEFRVQGTWDRPFIAASSDLVQFQIKSKSTR